MTARFCCYHTIWHCVLDLHILLWQDLSLVSIIFDIVILTLIFYCDKTFLLLPQYLTLWYWPSYFTVTTRFCCYHNIWHCVVDLHIFLWQEFSVVTTIFDIVILTFIFYSNNTFLLLPHYLTLCFRHSYFTSTRIFCCYDNIRHCVLDLHILLLQHVSVVNTLFDIMFSTFTFYCDNTFLFYHNIWHCVIDLQFTVRRPFCCTTIFDIVSLTFIVYKWQGIVSCGQLHLEGLLGTFYPYRRVTFALLFDDC